MVANTEMLFRTKSQKIRDSIDRHEKMIVSFGPNVDTNPSPSDPLIKSGLVLKVVDDLRRDLCPKIKTMYFGKLVLACLCRNQAKQCFGGHTKCDLHTHGNDFFGRFLTVNQDGFYCLFLSEDVESERMPYGLHLKIFDGKDHFLESDGVGGETVSSARFRYPQTLSKVVSYIYAKLGVAVGLEEVLPIRGNTRIIKSIGDFSLSSEISERQKEEAQEQDRLTKKTEQIANHSFVA